ncbi:hypothetical protein D3C78_712370 [compost metagenome]
MAAQLPMMPISPPASAGASPRSAAALALAGSALRACWRSRRMRATAWSISSWSKGLAM